jgi:uncharacterized membrane protein
VRATPDPLQQYLLRLAGGLEVLGPDESAEVLAEIRTHLAQAIADAGGDEAAALTGFGPPEEFAARILEERGIRSGDSGPAAPTWMQVAAHLIDVAVWLAVTFLLSPIASLFAGLVLRPLSEARASVAHTPVTLVVLAFLAVAVGWFFWIRKRNRKDFQTTGMTVMGLRRVQVGPDRRTVRRRDIPGLPKYRLSRAGAVYTALVVLVFLGAGIYSLASSRSQDQATNTQQAVQDATLYSTTAASQVSDVYRMVMLGDSTKDIEAGYHFADEKILTDLESRKAAGSLASYQMGVVELSQPDQLLGLDSPPAELDIVVHVYEYPSGEYDYHVMFKPYPVGYIFESYESQF